MQKTLKKQVEKCVFVCVGECLTAQENEDTKSLPHWKFSNPTDFPRHKISSCMVFN